MGQAVGSEGSDGDSRRSVMTWIRGIGGKDRPENPAPADPATSKVTACLSLATRHQLVSVLAVLLACLCDVSEPRYGLHDVSGRNLTYNAQLVPVLMSGTRQEAPSCAGPQGGGAVVQDRAKTLMLLGKAGPGAGAKASKAAAPSLAGGLAMHSSMEDMNAPDRSDAGQEAAAGRSKDLKGSLSDPLHTLPSKASLLVGSMGCLVLRHCVLCAGLVSCSSHTCSAKVVLVVLRFFPAALQAEHRLRPGNALGSTCCHWRVCSM